MYCSLTMCSSFMPDFFWISFATYLRTFVRNKVKAVTKIWRGLERFLVSQPKFGSAGGSLADDRLQKCDTHFLMDFPIFTAIPNLPYPILRIFMRHLWTYA